METNETLNPPQEWKNVSEFMQKLVDPGNPEFQDKFKKALSPGGDVTQFMEMRMTGLMNLSPISKDWEKFAEKFGENDSIAREALGLINKFIILGDETKAIRILDLFFGASGLREGSSIKSILNSLKLNDFKVLCEDLKSDSPLFISDQEIYNMTYTPTSPDASKRPVRYSIAALYTGGAGIEEVRGDLQKSIDYCKKEYLKI